MKKKLKKVKRVGTGVGVGHGGNTDLPDIVSMGMVGDKIPGLEPTTLFLKLGDCTIFASVSDKGWHLSIAHPDRYPTWDEVAKARYELLPPDKTFAMILPPEDEYINVHNFCFQVWEMDNPERGLITLKDNE